MRKSAIIIGAGVIGVCSAYALAKRGWQVTLVDRESGPAMGTSHANGAQLSYCYTDALASPATLAALPRLIGGTGGVSFGVDLSPDYLKWQLQFLRNCTPRRFRQNTLAVLDLAMQSSAAMDRLCERHEINFDHRIAGKIHLLYSAKDIGRATQLMQMKRAAGVEQQIVMREEFRQLDPGLATIDPTSIAAISTPSEVVGDPYRFCRAMQIVLANEYGVTSRFKSNVEAISNREGKAVVTLDTAEQLQADLAVVATGVWSNRLLAGMGHRQMIEPMKGYSFEMPLCEGSPRLSVTDGKRRLVFTNLGDRMRVAGIAELGNATRTIEPQRIEWMLDAVQECLPYGGDYRRADRFWTGLRPVTPNSQPIIARIGKSIAINTGHGALGWTLAMGSGERLAQLCED